MKIKMLALAALLLLGACPDSPTNPKDENPYKQEPIDWPSLADSPWPMYRHDPQNTGRSPYPGAISGNIVARIPSYNSQAGVVVGLDSTLYFYHEINGIYYLQATDYTGNLKWSKRVDREPSTVPVVLYDGSIVVIGLEPGEFIRLTATGDTLWQCFVEVEHSLWAVNPGLTVGLDTTIYYITSDRRLVAVSKNGKIKWSLIDERFSVEYTNMPAFSPDGKTLYVNGGNGVTLLAVDLATQSIKWTFGEIPLTNSLFVDNKGNIFANNGPPNGDVYAETYDHSFFSLSSTGILRWKYSIKNIWAYEQDPTIDWNGNVYFATDTLYSFTNDGKLRWMCELESYFWNPLVCDGNNYIYNFRDDDEIGLMGKCINESGELIWKMENTGERTRVGNSPIIFNNSILLAGWRSEWVYIIK